MQRPLSVPGTKFRVRGQLYVTTGHFYHTTSNDREVRVLELASICPECAEPFAATASMRQIRTRQLVRRCPACRRFHTGPVSPTKLVARRPVEQQIIGRAAPAAPRPCASARKLKPAQIKITEIGSKDGSPGETATVMQRVLSNTDRSAEPPTESVHDALNMLD